MRAGHHKIRPVTTRNAGQEADHPDNPFANLSRHQPRVEQMEATGQPNLPFRETAGPEDSTRAGFHVDRDSLDKLELIRQPRTLGKAHRGSPDPWERTHDTLQ